MPLVPPRAVPARLDHRRQRPAPEIEGLPFGVCLLTSDGSIADFNVAATRMLGKSAHALRRCSFSQIVGVPEPLPGLAVLDRRDDPWVFDVVARRRRRTLRACFVDIPREGEISHALVLEDISEAVFAGDAAFGERVCGPGLTVAPLVDRTGLFGARPPWDLVEQLLEPLITPAIVVADRSVRFANRRARGELAFRLGETVDIETRSRRPRTARLRRYDRGVARVRVHEEDGLRVVLLCERRSGVDLQGRPIASQPVAS